MLWGSLLKYLKFYLNLAQRTAKFHIKPSKLIQQGVNISLVLRNFDLVDDLEKQYVKCSNDRRTDEDC